MTRWSHSITLTAEVNHLSFSVIGNSATGFAVVSGNARVTDFSTLTAVETKAFFELNIHGETAVVARSSAITWPEHFDQIPDGFIGISSRGEYGSEVHIFLEREIFGKIVSLLHNKYVGISLYGNKLPQSDLLAVRQLQVSLVANRPENE
jgi:hypothetical protein